MVSLVLAGCSLFDRSGDDPDTHLKINKDGSVLSVIHESFQESNYDINEFRTETLSLLDSYNASRPDAVKLNKAELLDNGITDVELSFADVNTFADFNGEIMYVGIAGKILNSEYSIDVGNMTRMSDQGTMSDADMLALAEEKLLVADIPDRIYLPGKILYFSDNCDVSEDGRSFRRKEGNEDLIYVIYQ